MRRVLFFWINYVCLKCSDLWLPRPGRGASFISDSKCVRTHRELRKNLTEDFVDSRLEVSPLYFTVPVYGPKNSIQG